ncbi:MAG: restriction endonuclease subunit S [Alloprevotella sp.]|nr:MAG: restriction endonuclease subunit S [Alloprevotella sp.]
MLLCCIGYLKRNSKMKNNEQHIIPFIERLLDGAEVEWKELDEVAEVKRGRRLVRKELSETGRYAVFQNSMTPLGFYNEGNVCGDTTFIISAGAAGEIGYSTVDFWAADDIYYFLPTTTIYSKYLYYFLLTKQTAIKGQVRRASVPRLAKNAFAKIKIPIPPLSVQQEIVRILDKFTTLEAELEAELDCRKRQYEYYRNKLLSFDMLNRGGNSLNNIFILPLGEVCSVLRGKRLTKRELYEEGSYPVFHGGVEPIGYYSKPNREAHSAMIINVGASAGTIGYSSKEFWSSDGCFCFSHSESLSQRFLYYLLQSMEGFIKAKVRKAGIPTLDSKVIEKIKIPIPPLSEQKRIVSILDKFDTLTNSISEGLPKEIALRRKQYAHYRDRLLNFQR